MMIEETEVNLPQESAQPESQPQIDYRTEYEKYKQEAEQWRSKYTQRDTEYRAQHGQLAPTQRELAQRKKELDELRQQIESTKKKESLAEWETFAKDFPEEAKAHEARLTPLQKELEELRNGYTTLQKQAKEREIYLEGKARLERVLAKHPDFWEVAESQEFRDFGNTLPKAIQAAFEDQENLNDDLHVYVLDMYKRAQEAQKLNPKAEYVKTQGIAPKGKQTQAESTAVSTSDPGERRYLEALQRAKNKGV